MFRMCMNASTLCRQAPTSKQWATTPFLLTVIRGCNQKILKPSTVCGDLAVGLGLIENMNVSKKNFSKCVEKILGKGN